jgi:hypothetical protein
MKSKSLDVKVTALTAPKPKSTKSNYVSVKQIKAPPLRNSKVGGK